MPVITTIYCYCNLQYTAAVCTAAITLTIWYDIRLYEFTVIDLNHCIVIVHTEYGSHILRWI